MDSVALYTLGKLQEPFEVEGFGELMLRVLDGYLVAYCGYVV